MIRPGADDDVEHALHRPVETGEHRRPQLEERHALAGDVLDALRQELRRRRRDAHLDAPAVRLLDEIEQLLVADIDAADDQLVGMAVAQDVRQVRDASEVGQILDRAAVGEDAEELVVDPASAEPERAPQLDEPLAVADEHGASPRAGDAPHVARHDLVARAQHADHEHAEHERRRVQPEGRVLVARADRERERDHRDEQERRDDATGARALLARRVQPAAPEDEHRHEREERQPLRLGVPGQAPEDRPRAVVELPHDEREVERAREPAEVDRHQRGDAEQPPHDRPDLEDRGEEAGRPDVAGERRRPRRSAVALGGIGTDNRLRHHESGHCTPPSSGTRCGGGTLAPRMSRLDRLDERTTRTTPARSRSSSSAAAIAGRSSPHSSAAPGAACSTSAAGRVP